MIGPVIQPACPRSSVENTAGAKIKTPDPCFIPRPLLYHFFYPSLPTLLSLPTDLPIEVVRSTEEKQKYYSLVLVE